MKRTVVISVLCTLVGCGTIFGQDVFTSIATGKWEAPATWSCVGGCGSSPLIPGINDNVVVRHTVTVDASSGATQAKGVQIINSAGTHARLLVRGVAALTIGSGGLDIVSNDVAGNIAEIYLENDGTVGNNPTVTVTAATAVTITKYQTSNVRNGFNIRDGSNAIINGNFIVNYLVASSSAEAVIEVEIGPDPGDAPVVTINGNLTMNYNSTNGNTNCAFSLDNSSAVTINGNVVLNAIEGGSSGGIIQLRTHTDSNLTITGELDLNFLDTTSPSANFENSVRLDDNSRMTIGSMHLDSRSSTGGINNYPRVFNTATLTVLGDITFDNSNGTSAQAVQNRILIDDSGTLVLGGNLIHYMPSASREGQLEFQNTGTDNSKLILNGSVTQTVPVNLSNNPIKNIEINNTSGNVVTLDGNISVSNSLTLTTGILTSVSPNNLLTLENGASGNIGSATSYITGPVVKKGITPTAAVIPLGDNGKWAPLKLNNMAGTNPVATVQYFNTAYSDLDTDLSFDHVSGKEYWNITLNSGTITNYDVTLFWSDACSSQITDVTVGPQDLYVGWYNAGGSVWNLLSSSSINASNPAGIDSPSQACAGSSDDSGGITVTGISQTGNFTFISSTNTNPLPITLCNFIGRSEYPENQVLLTWSTCSEISSESFGIERLENNDYNGAQGLRFLELARIPSKGFSTELQVYSYVDVAPNHGYNYYRLTEYSLDGVKSYPSNVINVEHENKEMDNLIIYPNPVAKSNSLQIRLKNEVQMDVCFLELVDVIGNSVWKASVKETPGQGFTFVIPDNLFEGLYLLRVTMDQKKFIEQLRVTSN